MKIPKDLPPRYRCDPEKNKDCPKHICYRNRQQSSCDCKHTLNKEFKMKNIFKRFIEYLIY